MRAQRNRGGRLGAPHRSTLCRALAAALAVAACDEASPPLLSQSVRGVVVLDGPRSGARVELRTPADEPLASARTDAAGRFVLRPAVEPGRYRLVAALDDGAGALAALLPTLDYGTELDVRVDAFTTWTAALAEGAAATGEPSAADFARDAAVAHLGFDPVVAGPDEWRAPLLAAAFDALAARAARSVGARPEALSPATLLAALTADAQADATMDGLGSEGPLAVDVSPGTYALSAETLRTELALAVADALAEPEWSTLEPRDVRALTERLTCSESPVFPACRAESTRDATPPTLEWTSPADDTPLTGVVTFRATALDPESGVLDLRLAFGADAPEAAPPLVDEDPAPDALRVTLDTSALRRASVELVLTAENRDGVAAELRRSFAVDNLPGGVLRGSVFKGPAMGVEVAALPVDAAGSPGPALALAVTDAEGRFELALPEYRGALLLRATGREDGTGQYRNEAVAGESLTWGPEARLESFVPDFEPRGPGRERTVSPLTDLAVARARAQRSRYATFAAAWEEAIGRLGAHFGVEAPDTLRPTDPDEAAHVPPTDADRYLLALACLSRQARELATTLRPDAPSTFTPLDLVALYRADLEGDGVLDGRDGPTPLGLPPNAFRAELARACAFWLDDPEANTTGLAVEGVGLSWFADVSEDNSGLFDPGQLAAPFDAFGPEIAEPEFEALEGGIALGRVRGRIMVRIEATDTAGVSNLTVRTEPVVARATRLIERLDDGVQEWEIDTRMFTDGQITVIVDAKDSLGNESSLESTITVDNSPPLFSVTADRADLLAGSVFRTHLDQVELNVEPNEKSHVTISVDGSVVSSGDAIPGLSHQSAVRFVDDGQVRAEVHVVDEVGNEAATWSSDLISDRTPPTISLVPTQFVDERALNSFPLPVDLDDFADQALVLDEAAFANEQEVDVARHVDRWSGGAAPLNDPRLEIAANDLFTAAAHLETEWRRAPGPCSQLDDPIEPTRPLLSQPSPLNGADSPFTLPLSSVTLGFDPMQDENGPVVARCFLVSIRDDVGNTVTRQFSINAVRVSPAVGIIAVHPLDVRSPRIDDIDSTTATTLTDQGAVGVIGIAAWEFFGPNPAIPLEVELAVAQPALTVERRPVEIFSDLHFGGFEPPRCIANYPRSPDFHLTWAFLVQGPADWSCEPVLPLASGESRVPSQFLIAIDDLPYGPSFSASVSSDRMNPTRATLGFAPPLVSDRLYRTVASEGADPLNGVRHAIVVQGPGREYGRTLACAQPPCDVWRDAVRGEQARDITIELPAEGLVVAARFGSAVPLLLPQTLPRSRTIVLDP